MKNLAFAWGLVAFVVLPRDVTAFPSFLVNSCERPMQPGERIMGQPVLLNDVANAAQQHPIDVVVIAEDGTPTSMCGQQVNQGMALMLQVDETLLNAVTADGWTQGVGPNFLVEAENALITPAPGLTTAERGCSDSRIINPIQGTQIVPLQNGPIVVRQLVAYGFGQVYASVECTMTVVGGRTQVSHGGFLVNAATFATETDLATEPYTLTREDLLQADEYALLELLQDPQEPSTFGIKYKIDQVSNEQVKTFLQGLPVNETNIQVSVVGFESVDDATAVEVVSLSRCTSAATCEGFFSIPTEQVCLTDGLCIESSVVDEEADTITVTIVSNDDSWFAMGFSTSGGGMTAGGGGSDVFACSAEGLRRFLITARSNPSTSAASSETLDQDDPDDELIQNLCVLDTDAGTGRMTFTRPLSQGQLRAIVPGTAQAIIFARGPGGEQTLSSQHPAGRRGEVALDLTNLGDGPRSVKQEAEWILWCHIVFMSFSWGFFLPLAVVIAGSMRNVPGGKPGAWFQWHKALTRIGWLLQTMGALFGIYYCEVYSEHLSWEHTKLGVFIVIVGFLQPVSAILRPHPPKDGWPDGQKPVARTAFEIYHRGLGWVAMICGVTNVFVGANLVKDLGFEEVTSNLPISIGSIGAGFALLFFVLNVAMADNPIAKAMAGSKAEDN